MSKNAFTAAFQFTCQTRINFLWRKRVFFPITSTLGSMPAQLYHQTLGRHQTLGNVNGLRTAYLKGHLFSGQSHQRRNHQVLLLKHPHCKKGGIHPSPAFNKFLPDSLNLPWSQQSARFISKLVLQKEISLFCISPA